MANSRFTQFLDTLHKAPVIIDCQFTVDQGNANGLGIKNLKGAGVQAVYMNSNLSFSGDTHTNLVVDSIADTSILSVGMNVQGTGIPAHTKIASITSATAIKLSQATTATNSGVTISYQASGNPNPAAGYGLIQLQDNYKYLINGFQSYVVPTTSNTTSTTSGLTVGNPYVITALGTTTLAEWQDIGVPIGINPAIGVAFIATKTGTGGSHTGKVGLPSVSGISHIEMVGDPNKTIISSSKSVGILGGPSGAYIMFKFVKSSFAGTALGTHTHDLFLKNAAVSDGATTSVNAGANLLGANTGSDITVAGSGANGGIVATSAGTPAGTMSFAAANPTDLSVVNMAFYMSNSRIAVNGY